MARNTIEIIGKNRKKSQITFNFNPDVVDQIKYKNSGTGLKYCFEWRWENTAECSHQRSACVENYSEKIGLHSAEAFFH